MSERLDKLHFPADTAPAVTALVLSRHLMVLLESLPAASAVRSFATAHLLLVFPHSSGDHVQAGLRSAIKDDHFSINLWVFCTWASNEPPSSEFILCLQNLWLLQGNPATDRRRDAEEGGEGEMAGCNRWC